MAQPMSPLSDTSDYDTLRAQAWRVVRLGVLPEVRGTVQHRLLVMLLPISVRVDAAGERTVNRSP